MFVFEAFAIVFAFHSVPVSSTLAWENDVWLTAMPKHNDHAMLWHEHGALHST